MSGRFRSPAIHIASLGDERITVSNELQMSTSLSADRLGICIHNKQVENHYLTVLVYMSQYCQCQSKILHGRLDVYDRQ